MCQGLGRNPPGQIPGGRPDFGRAVVSSPVAQRRVMSSHRAGSGAREPVVLSGRTTIRGSPRSRELSGSPSPLPRAWACCAAGPYCDARLVRVLVAAVCFSEFGFAGLTAGVAHQLVAVRQIPREGSSRSSLARGHVPSGSPSPRRRACACCAVGPGRDARLAAGACLTQVLAAAATS
jgi:hypothetical protein